MRLKQLFIEAHITDGSEEVADGEEEVAAVESLVDDE